MLKLTAGFRQNRTFIRTESAKLNTYCMPNWVAKKLKGPRLRSQSDTTYVGILKPCVDTRKTQTEARVAVYWGWGHSLFAQRVGCYLSHVNVYEGSDFIEKRIPCSSCLICEAITFPTPPLREKGAPAHSRGDAHVLLHCHPQIGRAHV